jgi:hypothetical protein
VGGGDGTGAARDFGGPKMPKIHKTILGDTIALDEVSADEIKALAFSALPADKERVDAKLTPGERDNKAMRLIVAGKILEEEKPHLFAQEHQRSVLLTMGGGGQ